MTNKQKRFQLHSKDLIANNVDELFKKKGEKRKQKRQAKALKLREEEARKVLVIYVNSERRKMRCWIKGYKNSDNRKKEKKEEAYNYET